MNDSLRNTVIGLKGDGYTDASIAAALKLTQKEVYQLLNNLDFKPSITPPQKKDVFALYVEGKTVPEISNELDVSEESITKLLLKDAAKIKKNDERAISCLEMYKSGVSLQEISSVYGITRERVRQISKKQFAYDLGYGPMEQRYRRDEIDEKYRALVIDKMSERNRESIENKYHQAVNKGFEPQYFDSLAKYAEATGIRKEKLKEVYPEAYAIVSANAKQKARRWSWYYDQCRMCGTTNIKHRGYGYCENCYSKSPEWKESVKMSYFRNREARREKNKIYAEDYYNRPGIKEKIEKEYDEKYFGGNRKFVLERDGFKCLGCGMSHSVKDKSGKSIVRVWHIGDKDDHSVENLATYCQSCLYRKLGIGPRNGFGRKA